VTPEDLGEGRLVGEEDDPQELSEDYLQHLGSRVEWMRFTERFSAAIWVYRMMEESVRDRLAATAAQLHDPTRRLTAETEGALGEAPLPRRLRVHRGRCRTSGRD
jgi:hypothetical protein